jgi:NTP pyrophosphatase (non-canonical NTP hydrolase)
MGKFKDYGDPALALAEECAEVIQVITKMKRFDGDWDDNIKGANISRWEKLESEMLDVFYQWERLKKERDIELKIKYNEK